MTNIAIFLCHILAASLALAAAPTARAEKPSQMVERGIDLREKGRDAEALALMQEAYDLEPAARTAAQLGLVHQALGHWVEAEQFVMEALASTKDAWVNRNRGQLRAALETIRAKLGSLTVRGEPAGAEVRFAGRVIGTLPMAEPARVPAQLGPLIVSAPGYVDVVRQLEVKPGAALLEQVTLDPIAAQTPGDEDPFDRLRRKARQPKGPTEEEAKQLERLAEVRSGLRPLIGLSLGYHFYGPFIDVAASREGAGPEEIFGGSEGSAFVRLDGGVRATLSDRWDLVVLIALGFVGWESEDYDNNYWTLTTNVLQIVAELRGHVRPLSASSRWYLELGICGGIDVPLDDQEPHVSRESVPKTTTYEFEAKPNFGFSVGSGFMLDDEETWELALTFYLHFTADDGFDDASIAAALRLGYAF